jgi:hypothetical protein
MAGAAANRDSALAFGGNANGQPPTNVTEEYDGSSWTTGAALATARSNLGGLGTLSAGLAFAGYDGSTTNATEEYTGPGITTKICSSS